jgi:DNA polymerase elongation subunit (family B)
MQAKRSGDKATSDALKLVLNACFGAFNYPYSLLYSPQAFLTITVSGQLCLLALADRIQRLGRDERAGKEALAGKGFIHEP